jgi:DNA polymerase-3 subunit delta'
MDFLGTNVIGQHKLLDDFVDSVYAKKNMHAYMFCGETGIGKRTIAKALAADLLCSDPQPAGPCGVCRACLLTKNNSNPDYKVVRIQSDKRDIPISNIREIVSDMYTKPMVSAKKVYLIENGDAMNTSAQNCLLKSLEEPNKNVVIIITTSNPGAIIETIRSRVTEFALERNTVEEVEEALRIAGADEESIKVATLYSDGIIGKAIEFAISDEIKSLRNEIARNIPNVLDGKYEEMKTVMSENKESRDFIFSSLQTFIRDIIFYLNTGNENVLINKDKNSIILTGVEICRKKNIDEALLIAFTDVIDRVKIDIDYNAGYNNSINYLFVKFDMLRGRK